MYAASVSGSEFRETCVCPAALRGAVGDAVTYRPPLLTLSPSQRLGQLLREPCPGLHWEKAAWSDTVPAPPDFRLTTFLLKCIIPMVGGRKPQVMNAKESPTVST